MEQSADYVVAGAGSAGCILARRLAETGVSVILVEAGGPDRTRLVRQPGMIAIFHNVPALKKRLDWGYYTAPQENALGRRIPQPRGRVLGGSGSINGMVFVRGNRQNYDDWAAAGCAGWSYQDVLPSFKRFEDWEDGATALRGSGGPVKVTRQKDLTPASQAFIEALAATAGVKQTDDYNGEAQEGVGICQQNASGGLRYSSSIGYLDRREPQNLPNLTVLTGTHINKILIEKGRAAGVEVASHEQIHASREVILCAGVYGSPQLLMLSGVGPAGHLREHGITVQADLPVGDNLHDHLFVPMTYCMTSARHRGTTPHFVGGVLKEAIQHDSWMGRTVFEVLGFVRSPQAGPVPDLQIHVLPWSYPFPNQDSPERHKVDKRSALTIMPTLIYPKSRGTLRLASADPAAAPVIDPAYLAEPDDTRLLLDGMELVRATMASKIIADQISLELSPGPAYPDRAALARELPNRATSVYHAVGTCRMGTDEQAVVDPALRVRGIDGLRVADASIMPAISGGNTNAPAMMIGEHAARLIAPALPARRRLGIGRAEEWLVGGAEVGGGQAIRVELPDLLGDGNGDLDVLAAAGAVEALRVRAQLGLGVQGFVADREQGGGGDPVPESVRGHRRRFHVHGQGPRYLEAFFGQRQVQLPVPVRGGVDDPHPAAQAPGGQLAEQQRVQRVVRDDRNAQRQHVVQDMVIAQVGGG
jgi:choline dehydrogenase